VAEGVVDSGIDGEVVAELVGGAQLIHLLATGQAPSPAFSGQVADFVLEGL
jgi:hypothetical protein